MTSLLCSAPGKLFLGGEYAVLRGAPSVVTAVDRRAIATPVSTGYPPSNVIASVLEHLSRHLGQSDLPSVKVESPGFAIGRQKIGLGSSAAVTAAACGLLFEWANMPIQEHKAAIVKLAMESHRAAQGGRGSGADVAVAVEGGTRIYTIDGICEAVNPDSVFFVPVWSGRAASTTQLLTKIEEFAARDQNAHDSCFDQLEGCAVDLANSFRSNNAAKIIASTAEYGEAMKNLGQLSGANIVTSKHELTDKLARGLGGCAKPSGAGGGDVAVAVFDDPDNAKRFALRCKSYRLRPLDLQLGAQGLRRD